LPTFTWNVDPVLAHLGPIQLRWYSLIFVLVFLGGYWLLKWQVKRGGGDEEDAGDFIVYGVLGVLVGSRLGHVLFYDLDKALKDPFWVLRIWEGGLASHGAVIGLILAMYLFCKRRRIPFLEGADRFAFSAALGATLVRVGNWFNSEIVGRPTNGTWGVRLPRFDRVPDPPLRHPSQLYEVALGLFVFGALYVFDKKLGEEKRPRGALISLFFVLYFAGRFLVEFFKEHQTHQPTPYITMGQYLSIPGFLLGVYGLVWSFKHRLSVGWGSPEDEDEDDEDEEDEEDRDDSDREDEDDEGKAGEDEEAGEDDQEDEEEDEEEDDQEDEEEDEGEDEEDEEDDEKDEEEDDEGEDDEKDGEGEDDEGENDKGADRDDHAREGADRDDHGREGADRDDHRREDEDRDDHRREDDEEDRKGEARRPKRK
jgi:prolipoprotein diacylglyceryl transferase